LPEAAKDVCAEAARADSRRDGRHPDRDHGRDAHARQYHVQRQRKLHLPQYLSLAHPHRDRRLADVFVHAFDARHGVANEGQQRVEHERDDGRARADAAEQRKRDEETKERETRHGLQHARDAEHGALQRRAPRDENAQRDADEDGEHYRDEHEKEVLARGRQHLAPVALDELKQIHAIRCYA
jgi:hypothetical protein